MITTIGFEEDQQAHQDVDDLLSEGAFFKEQEKKNLVPIVVIIFLVLSVVY